jgi:hypothetical protein
VPYTNSSRGLHPSVLIADVLGDALTDGRCFAELVGEERFAARRLCQAIEHSRIPVRIILVEKTDGIL